ncbi:27990_t:CDS:2, partial [Racocetra persica]
DIATQNLDYDYKPKELNDKNWKEKMAQYKIYDELQLDIKEKELCIEYKYPYNEKKLLNRYCNKCYEKAPKYQIYEIEKEEFIPSKKLKVTTEIEEFNFEKIERTEIEQMNKK